MYALNCLLPPQESIAGEGVLMLCVLVSRQRNYSRVPALDQTVDMVKLGLLHWNDTSNREGLKSGTVVLLKQVARSWTQRRLWETPLPKY